MKTIQLKFILFFLAILGVITPGSIYSQTGDYVPDEIIVKFKSSSAQQLSVNIANNIALTGVSSIDNLNIKHQVKNIDKVYKFKHKNEALAKQIGLDRTFVLKVPAGSNIEDIIAEYAKLPDVEFAEPNVIHHAVLSPNDTYFNKQWGLKNTGNAESNPNGDLVGTPGMDIKAEAAWDVHTGGSSVILAIIDTGVDGGHPEFSGRMVAGYDFVNNDNDPMDDNGHGTSCAGIAAAKGNNGQGVAGVNWNCKIMAVKVLNSTGGGATNVISQGVTWAVDNGADVLSLSLGGGFASGYEDAFNYAFNSGVVIFAARGNNDNTNTFYPASFTNVIGVGGLSPCGERKTPSTCDGETWWGASYGGGQNAMDFVAPCTRIYTTDIRGSGGYTGGDYTQTFNGTSSACPFAAGVGALLRSYEPGLSPSQIRQRMRETCRDVGPSGYDDETGFGLINAYEALTGGQPQAPIADFGASATSIYVGESVNFTDQSSGSPTSWSWSFEGGSPSSSSSQNPTVTYNTAGTYNVSLTASNSLGSDTETKTNYITVTSGSVYQAEDYTNQSGCALSTEHSGYTGSGYMDYGGSGSFIEWNNVSGDGGSTATLTFRYANGSGSTRNCDLIVNGSTVVNLGFTATSTWATWTTLERNVSINSGNNTIRLQQTTSGGPNLDNMIVTTEGGGGDPPIANFSANVTSVNEGGSVNFTDNSSNSPTSWSWSFEGGSPSSSSSQNPTVTYNNAGTYNVTLTATNSYGSDTETKTNYITVTAPSNSVASVFQHCNYGGYEGQFDVGNFTLADMIARGVSNDDASSIRVNPGYEVTVYQHDNFGGYSWTITSDDACFDNNTNGRGDGTNWNDDISSMKVATTGGGSNVYQAEDYTNQSGCALSTEHSGYTGSGFMDYGGNGSFVEWNNVSGEGGSTATLTFRYANGSGSTRNCNLIVNGSTVANLGFTATSTWATWATIERTGVSINSGNNTIRLQQTTSGGPNLDKMTVVSTAGAAPFAKSIQTFDIDNAQSNSNSVLVYPNPANDVFTIELPGNLITTIDITDIQGRLVYQNTFTDKLNINTSDISGSGILFIKLTNENESYIEKLIIK